MVSKFDFKCFFKTNQPKCRNLIILWANQIARFFDQESPELDYGSLQLFGCTKRLRKEQTKHLFFDGYG